MRYRITRIPLLFLTRRRMSTPIEIVNSALRTLGARAITSFTEQINEARIANQLYNDAVIDVLRDYPWNSEAARMRLLEETEQRIASPVHYAGSGLNDLTTGGTIDSGAENVYRIIIDSVGGTDTFAWKADDDLAYTLLVAITGAAQLLSEGLEITFGAVTGHTLRDEWHVDTKLPETKFDHRYRLPNDFLLGKQIDELLRLFRVEGDFLLTNVGEPISLEYTSLRGDPDIVGLFTGDVPYEASLITALIARLKAEFAYPITKNDGLVQTCWGLYQQKLKEARAASRREGSIEVVQDTQYEDLRRGAGVIEDALDVGRIINVRFGF